MAPAGTQKKSKPPLHPRILVVDDEPGLVEVIGDVVKKSVKCRLISAGNIAEARQILATQSIQLLVADVNLPDGDGTSLLTALQETQPQASAIVITGSPSLEGAIAAMRQGALDFVPKPFTRDQLVERLRRALRRQARLARQEQRIDRLKGAVRRLNDSRRLISRKVDLLCNDLISAYGELSKQLDGVRTTEAFRKFIANAKDLEQLLCHSMDWLLRQLGYCNVAVWLASDEGDFQLGAYMKYTIAGDQPVTDAIHRVIVPPTLREGGLHVTTNDLRTQFTPAEMALLKDQDVLAINCTYLGESLAAVVFFRDARSPFTADDDALAKAISPIFAVNLASVVRGDAPEAQDSEEPSSNSDTIDEDKPRKPRKEDPADWWKNGGDSPY
jgi:response regulator of citrate/malate metabolism